MINRTLKYKCADANLTNLKLARKKWRATEQKLAEMNAAGKTEANNRGWNQF
jgi:hypothetical protein